MMEDATKIGLGVVLGVFVAIFAVACLCLVGGAGWAAVVSSTMSSTAPFLDPAFSDCGGFSTVPVKTTTLELGEAAEYGGMEVEILNYEFSGGYADPYEYYEAPPDDATFLWVEMKVSNTSDQPAYAPYQEEFSVVADGIQYESAYYSERPGYAIYNSAELFPQAGKLGWVRFTIPESSMEDELWVGFMPYDDGARTIYKWELAPVDE
jgi:hypothetical protein